MTPDEPDAQDAHARRRCMASHLGRAATQMHSQHRSDSSWALRHASSLQLCLLQIWHPPPHDAQDAQTHGQCLASPIPTSQVPCRWGAVSALQPQWKMSRMAKKQLQLVGPATAPLNVNLLTPILLTAAPVSTASWSTSKIGSWVMVGTDMALTLLWFSLSRLQFVVPHFT